MIKKSLKSVKSSKKSQKVTKPNVSEVAELKAEDQVLGVVLTDTTSCEISNEFESVAIANQQTEASVKEQREVVLPKPKIELDSLIKHMKNNGFEDDCIRSLVLSFTNMNSPKCNVELMNTQYVENLLMSLNSSEDSDVEITNSNASINTLELSKANNEQSNNKLVNPIKNSPIDVITADINVKLQIPYKREGTQCVMCCDDGLSALLGCFSRISTSNRIIGEGVFKTKSEITADSLTLGEGLEQYFSARKLKAKSLEGYSVAFALIFKEINDNWKDIPMETLTTDFFIDKGKVYFQYVHRVAIVFRWCYKRKLIAFNPIEEAIPFITKPKAKPRAALECHKWRRLSDAKKVLFKFFEICKDTDKDVSQFLLLLFIVGVRITECMSIIKNFDDTAREKHFIYISTKTSEKDAEPDFCVPLSRLVIQLIEKAKTIVFGKKGEKTIDKLESNFLARLREFLRSNVGEFNGCFTLHGTRSVYRTIIPLTKYNFSHAAMEKYLDHVVGSSVERIYDRQDYFEERQKIQCVYSYFLSTCYGDKNIIAEAKKSIVEYNSNVDDKNNIIVIDETWEK